MVNANKTVRVRKWSIFRQWHSVRKQTHRSVWNVCVDVAVLRGKPLKSALLSLQELFTNIDQIWSHLHFSSWEAQQLRFWKILQTVELFMSSEDTECVMCVCPFQVGKKITKPLSLWFLRKQTGIMRREGWVVKVLLPMNKGYGSF